MVFNAIGLLSGMLSLFFIATIQQVIVLIFISVILFLLVRHYYQSKTVLLYCLFGIFWSATSSICWLKYVQNTLKEPRIAAIEGTICSIPQYLTYSIKFDFCLNYIDGHKVSRLSPGKLKLSWGKYAIKPVILPEAGQAWLFKAKLRPARGRVNPGAFDYERWKLANQYLGKASVKNQARLLSKVSLAGFYHQGRQAYFNNISKLLPDNEIRPMVLAMLFGDRKGLSPEQWQVFQASGTAHLLAISGLHTGIAALWSYWLVFLLWKSSSRLCLLVPAQISGQLASLFGAFSVVLLSGAGLPAQRAFLMLFIFLVSRWSGRHYRLSSVLGMALIIILLFQPFSVLTASFWLSFIAVGVIASVLNQQSGTISRFKSWLKINFYLYITLLPVSLLSLSNLSWVSFAANLILIPAYSFLITPLLYMAAVTSVFTGNIASFLFGILSWLMEKCYWLQSYLAEINQKLIYPIPDTYGYVLALIVPGVLLFNKKLVSRFCLIPTIFLAVLITIPNKNKTDRFELVILDVGQGLAVYVETSEGNLLFDTAWGSSDYAVANATIIPFLKSRNIRKIDKLVISHNDSDHAGGLSAVTQHFEVGALLTGEPFNKKMLNATIQKQNTTIQKQNATMQKQNATMQKQNTLTETRITDNAANGIRATSCHHAADWQWGKVEFLWLKHNLKGASKGNNASCVLSIKVYDQQFLLTGDIEKSVENKLVKSGISQYDLVVAPHHGSKTSSTPAFVLATQPKHIVFSTGYDNQWQFPRHEVVKRYQEQGSMIWITHKQGAIIARFDSKHRLVLSALRQQKNNFWLNN